MELVPGEDKIFTSTKDEEIIEISDNYINNKYIKGDARIVTEQARYPLNTIPNMVDSDDYELNPEFQRRHRWDNQKKSRLIESFIINVPIPPIFLYEDEYSHYEVMDGLQRLTAIKQFYRNEFKLEGLEEWPELNGRKYGNLPDKIRKGIDRRYLSSIILLQETAKDENEALRLKQLVFERINSGGVQLEPQESRNAIYNGPLNERCIMLARNRYLCATWGIPEPDLDELMENGASPALIENKHFRCMFDVELVLRFFAYRQRLKYHRGALKDYLDEYLKNGNLMPAETLNSLSELFENTIRLAYDLLGEKAFWLYRKRKTGWGWFSRPTTAVYDPMMYALSGYSRDPETLLSKGNDIRSSLPGFYKENYEKFEGRYTNIANIQERNNLFSEFFESF
jgi:hypothetical protein|tara:strand:- start:1446 stop:2636 length:1191 start_codon:yes stop_codon:yes gene_type:complete